MSSLLQEDPTQTARAAGLRYVNDAMPGIARRAWGKHFRYTAPDGASVRDADTLERIRLLAIPPAWVDVWICLHPAGHLQATGRDARQRKQYKYHADWGQARDRSKFSRSIAFGEALPKLRRALSKALKGEQLDFDKVVAMLVAVMANTLIRVGNEQYTRSNRSFGLTTLRNRHVKVMRDGALRFQFTGKSGMARDVTLTDARLGKLVRRCQQLPGQYLFQYRDADGVCRPVDSADVNDWLAQAMGGDFTAKDFRTWGATLLAFRILAKTPLPEPTQGRDAPSERALAQVEKAVVTEVAAALGNTPAVCRKSYIDPSVFSAWREARLSRYAKGAIGERQWEQATLRFLRAQQRRASR